MAANVFVFPFLLSLCAKLCYIWSAVIKQVDMKKPLMFSHVQGLVSLKQIPRKTVEFMYS